MASIAEVIDFLMSLMRDDDARKQFERDPDATLTDRGLENVTGQDVRDARLMMADEGMVSPRGTRPERSQPDRDAVREIQHTSSNFQVGDVTTTVITINDNDTVVVDSFNTDVTAIQDNDTTDVDVINIEDDDGVEQGEDEGDLGGEPEDSGAEEGAAPEGGLEAGEELVGAAEGAAPDDDGLVSGGELPGEDSEEFDSGTDEGFVPEHDSGFGAEFGVQPPLGAEAGLTPEEPLDELVG
jgi:hypothetical protein